MHALNIITPVVGVPFRGPNLEFLFAKRALHGSYSRYTVLYRQLKTAYRDTLSFNLSSLGKSGIINFGISII
jgi:hypothetical protein